MNTKKLYILKILAHVSKFHYHLKPLNAWLIDRSVAGLLPVYLNPIYIRI